jgi:hypothetical protein
MMLYHKYRTYLHQFLVSKSALPEASSNTLQMHHTTGRQETHPKIFTTNYFLSEDACCRALLPSTILQPSSSFRVATSPQFHANFEFVDVYLLSVPRLRQLPVKFLKLTDLVRHIWPALMETWRAYAIENESTMKLSMLVKGQSL